MKNKKLKQILCIGLILCILASIGIGAYLTSTDVKSDVYTVGNVSAEIIANGDMEIDNVGALLPGTEHVYQRAVKNTGINDAYVFLSLTIPYEMVGVSDEDGTQIGERTRQLFTPGVEGGYIGAEWKLVDVGFIGEYEIEDNGQYCGEHDKYSAVVGDTITYVYGFIGDNTDGSLKVLKSGEQTSNLVETMKLTNLYSIDKIDGEISTKLYAIQDAYVNGGISDVNGVWAVINSVLFGEEGAVTLTYSIRNTNTGDAVGYAPLKLINENGEVVATSVATENGTGQFQNIPAGDYTVETEVGNLIVENNVRTYSMRSFGLRNYANKVASVSVTKNSSINLGLETPENTLVQGTLFGAHIPRTATAVNFISTDEIPADAIDVSEAADGSVMLWIEGSVVYVSSVNGGTIYANPNSASMFDNKQYLTHINTENLNTFGVCNANSMFYNCRRLTNDVNSDFDFTNTKSFQRAFYNYINLTEFTAFPEGITTISEGMFLGCSNLTTITIPSTIEEIEANAFYLCKNLTTVIIPEGVTTIGEASFQSCSNLTAIELPSSLTYIGPSSFWSTSLTSIDIPQNVDVISEAFSYCFELTSINVNPKNECFTSVDGVLFTKDMKVLIQYPRGKSSLETSYTVPSGVKEIGTYAFRNTSLSKVNLPQGLVYIGTNAFFSSSISSIKVPNTVTTIADNAFDYCSSLSSIEIPTSVTSIGTNVFRYTSWLTAQQKAHPGEIIFINNIIVDTSGLSGDVILPDNLTEIPKSAFSVNNKITSIYIPASITKIGESAFVGCGYITTITFEEGSQLKEIGKGAFNQCFNLTNIKLPEGLTIINERAFYGCGFEEIYIPSSVTEIGSNAFDYDQDLKAIIVDPANEYYTSVDGVLFSKDMKTLIQYPMQKTDTSYEIPSGVVDIDCKAFAYNTYLKEITVPTSVVSFGEDTFYSGKIAKINYRGSQAKWNKLDFGNNWLQNAKAIEMVYNYK